MHFGDQVLRNFRKYREFISKVFECPLTFDDEATVSVLRAVMPLVRFPEIREPVNTLIAGNMSVDSYRESTQFCVNPRSYPHEGLLIGIRIDTDTSFLYLGVFPLQGDQWRSLIVANTWSPREFGVPPRGAFTVPQWDGDRIESRSSGALSGIPRQLAAVSGGDRVFGEWYEALGMALASAMLEFGWRSMLADDFKWNETLGATWVALADEIRFDPNARELPGQIQE